MIRSGPFRYPDGPIRRRHAPVAPSYRAYKDWARDEFQFRCAYCLHRETWERDGWRSFQLDHVLPRASNPSRADDYANIIYACASCNRNKGDRVLPDPCEVAYREILAVGEDAEFLHLTREGSRIVDCLNLNAEYLIRFRRSALETYRQLQALMEGQSDLELERLLRFRPAEEFLQRFGYPRDLPDLRRKRPRRASADSCYFARLERGEIAGIYA